MRVGGTQYEIHIDLHYRILPLLTGACSHSAGYAEEERGSSPPLHQLPQTAQGLEGTAHALRVRETPINIVNITYCLKLC